MTAQRLNCAIYTRKSSEEGLDQVFNTLAAQREACLSYISSQKHEGWKPIATEYDDGGFSGGSMDRPALRKLMDDIEDGKVNVVVVYKVDRLTRSLADFAKLVELFDSHGVSFVSVTQQFNTTTSMGRLTLNVLLSFAQFEREVAGERIRDKIAASKRKGMWMGGPVPLGYKVQDRKLYIVPEQAEQVRQIFETYVEKGNVFLLQEELKKAKTIEKDIGRGALYTMLQNPIYIGKIRHQDKIYEGQHKAIIGHAIWEQAQAILQKNRVHRSASTYGSKLLLIGKIYDDQGNRLSPTSSLKKGKRYSYYTSSAAQTRSGTKAIRLPAGDIDRMVLEAVGKHMGAQSNDIPDIIEKVTVDRQQIVIKLCNIKQPITIEYHIAETGPYRHIVPKGEIGTANETQKKVLQNLMVKAFTWRDRLFNEPGMTVKKLATEEGIDDSYITRTIMCSFMNPTIVKGILSGTPSPALTRRKLMVETLPIEWHK